MHFDSLPPPFDQAFNFYMLCNVKRQLYAKGLALSKNREKAPLKTLFYFLYVA